MLLAIIGGLVCITMGALMYVPKMRNYKLFMPTSFFFIFEGIWILADYIFRQIFPDNVFMQAVHCIGLVILAVYFFICAFFSGKNPEHKNHEPKILKKRSFRSNSSDK